ncbi:uncharacterized [Tachysurus ichikawai]
MLRQRWPNSVAKLPDSSRSDILLEAVAAAAAAQCGVSSLTAASPSRQTSQQESGEMRLFRLVAALTG